MSGASGHKKPASPLADRLFKLLDELINSKDPTKSSTELQTFLVGACHRLDGTLDLAGTQYVLLLIDAWRAEKAKTPGLSLQANARLDETVLKFKKKYEAIVGEYQHPNDTDILKSYIEVIRQIGLLANSEVEHKTEGLGFLLNLMLRLEKQYQEACKLRPVAEGSYSFTQELRMRALAMLPQDVRQQLIHKQHDLLAMIKDEKVKDRVTGIFALCVDMNEYVEDKMPTILKQGNLDEATLREMLHTKKITVAVEGEKFAGDPVDMPTKTTYEGRLTYANESAPVPRPKDSPEQYKAKIDDYALQRAVLLRIYQLLEKIRKTPSDSGRPSAHTPRPSS